MQTIQIQCSGYSLVADVYEPFGVPKNNALHLIGRTSSRKKQHYKDLSSRLARDNNTLSVVFDYSGHGDSPFNLDDIYPAQNFLEVVTVYDWMQAKSPKVDTTVIGSSYGGYMAAKLIGYRDFEKLVLRAPAIYNDKDLYTMRRHEIRADLENYRINKEALMVNQVIREAENFSGRTLIAVHELDEVIPKQTTDAYTKALKAETYLAKGMSHSLDNATKQQVSKYLEEIYDWLTKH